MEGQLECLGENTEEYITFSVPIKKELDNGKSVTYKIKLIDSFRFVSRSLSNLVNNLTERIHNDKCIDCKSCLDYYSVKDDQRSCTLHSIEFCNEDFNRFILLLRKGVYSYQYMDS